MSKEIKKRAGYLLITAASFGLLYFLSKTYLSDVYVFEWTARNKYMYVWAVALVLILFGKIRLGMSITIGNMAGILIGQFLGDFLRDLNIQKITPDMEAGTVFQLQYHKGVFIWFETILIFIVGSAVWGFAVKRLHKEKSDK